MTATSLPQPVVRDSVSYGLQLSPGLPPLNSATVRTLLGLQELSAPLQKVLTLWCHERQLLMPTGKTRWYVVHGIEEHEAQCTKQWSTQGWVMMVSFSIFR